MKYIQQQDVPILPVKLIVNDECVAYGVGTPGVVVQFLERDKCILIEWQDIIGFGIELLKIKEKNVQPDVEEIEAPTVID